MAEKKAAECCGRVISHKKDGFPYAHTCEPQGQWQDKPVTRTCACGEISTMGPFPGRHEVTGCDYPNESDPFTTPTKAEDYNGEDVHPDEPTGDHRKWCTRCKLLGHYAADCTTAVLQGGVVSVPEPAPATHTGRPAQHSGSYRVADPDGSLTRRAIEALNRRTPEQKAETAARMDARVSALLGLPPEEAGGECECGRSTSNDNEVCDTCAEPAPATHTGRPAQHTSPYIAALAAEVGDVGTVTLPAQEYHPGAEPAQHSGQYLDDDPPLTGPLVDKAREVTSVAALVAAGARVREGLSDPFSTPTQPAEELNVSGQPAARYEWYGKQNRGYLVKLPETGDFRRYKNGKPKGLTRATTFNKAATDQNALGDWKARNVLIGASKRPDLVAKAHGLTHEDNRDELMKLVAELETTAGAKVSADVGTLIHELTEQWDAGTITMADIPAAYQPLIVHYTAELQAAGLRPVPGLIERTTYIPEFGGVVGTLDRVYYHEASGQYVIGDVKTGKTLKYGMDEIETQEWIYAHGVNNAGVYDWNTDRWIAPFDGCDCDEHLNNEDCKGPREVVVSEEWGVVVHMPVQGDDAGKVMLVRADLQRGRRHAEVCHDVRVQRANKPKPEAWTGEELKAPETAAQVFPLAQLREDAFRCVTSKAHAAQLWQEAYDAGVPPEEMEKLKEIADARLKELEKPAERSWEESFRYVRDVAHAGRLWESARAAGVEPMELNRLVQIAQQTLREAGVTG